MCHPLVCDASIGFPPWSLVAGVAKYGSPLSLDDKLKVDLIVVGSTAVDRNGARLGKGEVKLLLGIG